MKPEYLRPTLRLHYRLTLTAQTRVQYILVSSLQGIHAYVVGGTHL